MTSDTFILKAFAIGGFRSFGDKIQRFSSLSKVNIFIGKNNCGKSNILRFLHEAYSKVAKGPVNLDELDRHIPVGPKFIVGVSIFKKNLEKYEFDSDSNSDITHKIQKLDLRLREFVYRVFSEKAKLDDGNAVWFDFHADRRLIDQNWELAFNILSDSEILMLWSTLTSRTGGSRAQHWYPESLRELTPAFKPFNVEMVPAIRQVGRKGSVSEDFSGEGIIERLAQFQNPDVYKRKDQEKFKNINAFLQNVTDNKTAIIEIPHDRNTILVTIDGKTLPLESLGTGIHEVIILAAAATVLENTVICMEEPELHLNAILQKKLIRYLLYFTNNQYFISTHSAAFIDSPGAEIYHIRMKDGQSISEHASSNRQRSAICEDLGYHPSDLLQANCVVWVEGPSDRIYLNYWISLFCPTYIEGIHYSIMFYGGRLASHISGDDIEELLEDFISLRRLNRRAVILIDSDKEKERTRINQTKKRLCNEFDKGPGFSWVTKGREIENYLNPSAIKEAISKTMPSAQSISAFGAYENTLSVKTKNGRTSQASKVKVAKYIAQNFEPDFNKLDLRKQVQKLVEFIQKSNPGIHADGAERC